MRQSWIRGGISELWRWRPSFVRGEDMLSSWARVLARRGQGSGPQTLQVYVHVPYCSSRCGYCMYWSNRLKQDSELDQYVDVMVDRLARYRSVLGPLRATTAYWGGGSPSLLDPGQLERLLWTFGKTFQVDHLFTFEANPGSLSEDKLRLLRRYGVRRLSLGVQSFDPEVLDAMSRHNPPASRIAELVAAARRLGLLVNADLVFGLPGQTQTSFRRDVRELSRLQPDTINLYRYQAGVPLRRSAELAGSPIEYHQALGRDPSLLWALLRQGYLFAWPRPAGDDDDSHILSRLSAPVRRAGLAQLAQLARRRDLSTFYDCFDDSYSHLLGLGPGAYAHVHGVGWYREVTAPAALAAGRQAVFYGSRLSPDDEAASFMVQRLLRGQRLTARGLERRFGRACCLALLERARVGLQAGVLERRWGRMELRPRAPARARDRFLASLMPEPPTEPRDLLALSESQGVDLVRDVSLELLNHSALPTGRPLALWAWSQLLGLERVGVSFRDGTVEHIENRTIRFCLAGHDLRLTVLVDWVGRPGRCYGRSRRFALTWVAQSPTSLPAEHRALLDALLDRTRRLDP